MPVEHYYLLCTHGNAATEYEQVMNMQKTIVKESGNNKPNSVQRMQDNKGVISAVMSKRLSNGVTGKD